MESWSFPRFSRPHTLQILVLLGSLFCGAGVDEEPRVHLYHQYINAVHFNCSSQWAFPNHTSAWRMLQIKYRNETNHDRGDIWAIIENGTAPVVGDSVLKTMRNRSIHVNGSINKANVSWLHLTLFGPELDMSMRIYGTMTCHVWNKTIEWTSENIYLVPGTTFHLEVNGFEVRNDSAVDLTCTALIPPQGSRDATLYIRTADNATLASWSRDKNLQCSENAMCSPVLHINEVYFHVKIRLMKAPERGTEYRCYVRVKGKEYPSQMVQIMPDSKCCSSDDSSDCICIASIVGVVLAAFGAFMLGGLLATYFQRHTVVESRGVPKHPTSPKGEGGVVVEYRPLSGTMEASPGK